MIDYNSQKKLKIIEDNNNRINLINQQKFLTKISTIKKIKINNKIINKMITNMNNKTIIKTIAKTILNKFNNYKIKTINYYNKIKINNMK